MHNPWIYPRITGTAWESSPSVPISHQSHGGWPWIHSWLIPISVVYWTAASFSHHGQFGPYRLLCTSSPVKILCHLKAYWKTVSVDGITNCFPLLLGPCSANTNRNSESNPWQLKQDQVISGVVQGKIYRKSLYFMEKRHGFPVKMFPQTNPLRLGMMWCSH